MTLLRDSFDYVLTRCCTDGSERRTLCARVGAKSREAPCSPGSWHTTAKYAGINAVYLRARTSCHPRGTTMTRASQAASKPTGSRRRQARRGWLPTSGVRAGWTPFTTSKLATLRASGIGTKVCRRARMGRFDAPTWARTTISISRGRSCAGGQGFASARTSCHAWFLVTHDGGTTITSARGRRGTRGSSQRGTARRSTRDAMTVPAHARGADHDGGAEGDTN